MRQAALAILALVGIAAAPYARGQTVIFVPGAEGFAWWAGEITVRPMSKSVQGHTVEEINQLRISRKGMRDPDTICFVDAVTDNSIVSPNRAVQLEINKTLKEWPRSFENEYRTGGNVFRVTVAAYELCGKDPTTGTAIVVVDESGKLKAFDPQEFMFTRIYKRDDGILNIFGCFACGDVSELRYDAEADRFYFTWIGH